MQRRAVQCVSTGGPLASERCAARPDPLSHSSLLSNPSHFCLGKSRGGVRALAAARSHARRPELPGHIPSSGVLPPSPRSPQVTRIRRRRRGLRSFLEGSKIRRLCLVIDESCVSRKPKKEDKHDCLVRLYGTCQYLYVDPWKFNSEFEMMLKQENKSAMEAFHEVVEKELSCDDSPSNYDEEAINSKDGFTKGTSKKNSSRKVRKQEGLKPQYNEEEGQDVGSTETTGVTARKRKGGRQRQSSSTYDGIDKASSESSAEVLRIKRQKHGVQSVSVDRREGLRQSARSDAKQYLDAAGDSSQPLTDMHASDDATEASMLDGTSAPHTEIKAMVRDILFKDIIDREHDADMAYVDEVINGICGATEDIMSGGATASTKGGQGVKQSGSGVEGESSNIRQRCGDEATSPDTKNGNNDMTRGSSGEDTGAT